MWKAAVQSHGKVVSYDSMPHMRRHGVKTLVSVQCHWSLCSSSFNVGKDAESRFIPRLNKSTTDWVGTGGGIFITGVGDVTTGGGLLCIESMELNA
jgi:hypothetical protein